MRAGGAIKHFIITGVNYPLTNTTLKLYGGTDHDLANSAIIEPYFSMAKAPYGFPLDEAKWWVESLVTADSSQASPVAGGPGIIRAALWRSLLVAGGRVEYAAELEVTRAAAGALDVFATLSTDANSEVNKEATTKISISSGISMRGSVSHCGYLLDLAAKATYYLNCKTGSGIHAGDRLQGKRAENKGEGGVRVFMTMVGSNHLQYIQLCSGWMRSFTRFILGLFLLIACSGFSPRASIISRSRSLSVPKISILRDFSSPNHSCRASQSITGHLKN